MISADETGFHGYMTELRDMTVYCSRDNRQNAFRQGSDLREHITMLPAIAVALKQHEAEGVWESTKFEQFPPLIVYSRSYILSRVVSSPLDPQNYRNDNTRNHAYDLLKIPAKNRPQPFNFWTAANSSGNVNSLIVLNFFKMRLIPEIRSRGYPKSAWCLIKMDLHSTHVSELLLQLLDSENCYLHLFPPHATHLLQEEDVKHFGVLKPESRKDMDTFHNRFKKVNLALRSEDFPYVIQRSFNLAFTEKNSRAAYELTGLVPWNPDIVLGKMHDSEGKVLTYAAHKAARAREDAAVLAASLATALRRSPRLTSGTGSNGPCSSSSSIAAAPSASSSSAVVSWRAPSTLSGWNLTWSDPVRSRASQEPSRGHGRTAHDRNSVLVQVRGSVFGDPAQERLQDELRGLVVLMQADTAKTLPAGKRGKRVGAKGDVLTAEHVRDLRTASVAKKETKLKARAHKSSEEKQAQKTTMKRKKENDADKEDETADKEKEIAEKDKQAVDKPHMATARKKQKTAATSAKPQNGSASETYKAKQKTTDAQAEEEAWMPTASVSRETKQTARKQQSKEVEESKPEATLQRTRRKRKAKKEVGDSDIFCYCKTYRGSHDTMFQCETEDMDSCPGEMWYHFDCLVEKGYSSDKLPSESEQQEWVCRTCSKK